MKIKDLLEKAQKLYYKKLKGKEIKNSITTEEYEKYINNLMAEAKCENVKVVYINEPVVVKEVKTEKIIERESEALKLKNEELEKKYCELQEQIEELEIELKKYKQACIELDAEITKRDNIIGEMKIENYQLEQTIENKNIEITNLANELETIRKEKQNLIDNPIIKEIEVEKIVYKDLSEKPKQSFWDKLFK